MARKRLGELLLEAGAIDELQLRSALGEQRKLGRPLGRVLVELRMITEETMVSVLSQQLNIPAVQLERRSISPEALSMLSNDFCERHSCMPFGYQERGRFLDVAMADPTNQTTFDQIRVTTRCNIRPHLAGPMAIETAIQRHYYGTDASAPDNWLINNNSRNFKKHTSDDLLSASSPNITELIGASLRSIDHANTITDLKNQIAHLRAMVDRDEAVLRRLMSFLIEKGLCTREELLARISVD